MAREICKLTMTVVEEDEATTATGSVSFDGNGLDMIHVIEHVFGVLQLEPMEAFFYSMEAVEHMKHREDDEDE